MDLVEREKQHLTETIAALFQNWKQQLRQKSEEYDTLAEKANDLQSTLKVKDELITKLSNENTSLRKEIDRLQFTSGEDDSPRLKALTEKHNNLYKEYELQKATATANEHELRKRLRYERAKVKGWARFSSPGPRPEHSVPEAASGTNHVQAQKVDENKIHTGTDGSGASENGPLQQLDGLCRENRPPFPTIEHRSDRSFEGGSNNPQPSTETLQRNTPTSSRSRLIEQPGNSLEHDSSFVDAHLLHEPRAASPDLPSISMDGQPPISSNGGKLENTGKAANQGSLPQIRNSDSTDPPSEPPVIAGVGDILPNDDPDSDAPEFLGARSVRKKRFRGNATVSHFATGNTSEPVVIKSDPDTSFVASRPPQLTRFGSSIHESLDPSTSQYEQKSPRKQRPETNIPSPSTSSRIAPQVSIPSLRPSPPTNEDHVSQAPKPLQNQLPNDQRGIRGNIEQRTALREIDGNLRKVQKDTEALSSGKSKKRKSDESRGVAAIPIISEDGENYARKAPRISKYLIASPQLANPSVHQRLNNLLTSSPASKDILLPISRTTVQEMDECLMSASLCCTYSAKKPFNALLQADEKDWEWWDEAHRFLTSRNCRTPKVPFSHPSKQQERRAARNLQISGTSPPKLTPPTSRSPAPAATKRTPIQTPQPPTITPQNQKLAPRSSHTPTPEPPPHNHNHAHPPYRTLPLPSLTLSHFKPNPSANHNLSYAFTDVVRDHSARKCLPGCIRPECCGPKFAALAQTLHHQQRNEGAAAAEAVQDLANRYGTSHHRTLHARPPSPPGFWNVDFASTQERQLERAEAERRERAEVERRWRSAVADRAPGGGGGLWMFADE